MNVEIAIKIIKYILNYVLEFIRAINWPIIVFILIAVFNKKILEIIDKIIKLIETGKLPLGKKDLLAQAKPKDIGMEQQSPLNEKEILNKLSQEDLSIEHFQLLSTIAGQSRFSTISIPIYQIIGNLNNDAIYRADLLLSELDRKGFIKYDKTKEIWSVQMQKARIPFLREILKESLEALLK